MNENNLDMLSDVTGIGDSVVLGILSLVLAVYFFVLGYRREPLAIIMGFLLPAAIIGTLKIAFYICQTNLWGIVSPSGHSAISISVLGVSALILAKICTGVWRALIPLALVILAIVIALSRTILGMHTDGDVVIGSLIGIAVVIAIGKVILSYRIKLAEQEEKKRRAHPAVILLLAIIVVTACYGIKLPSEKLMMSFAKEIRQSLPVCP